LLEIIRGENLLDKRTFTVSEIPIDRSEISFAKAEIIQNGTVINAYTYSNSPTASFRGGIGDNEFILEISKNDTINMSFGNFSIKYTVERVSSEFLTYGHSVSCTIVIPFKVIQ